MSQTVLGGLSGFEIRSISVADALPLRQALLRPHQTWEELLYPDDNAPDSLHLGAFLGDRLVAIASVSRHPMPGGADLNAWQLRCLATAPQARRRGCGTGLVRACITHVSAHGGTCLWCNGRSSALGFYRAVGFETRGAEFHVPVTGPHYVMWQQVHPQGAKDER